MLHIGAKVICIEDCGRAGGKYIHEALPKRGAVYTIRQIIPREAYGYAEDGLLLEEIVNPALQYRSPRGPITIELMFRVRRFRPASSTNIDVFLKMLELVQVKQSLVHLS